MRADDHEKIVPGRPFRPMVPERLAKPPLDPLSRDRVPDATAHGETEAKMVELVRQAVDQEWSGFASDLRRVDGREAASARESPSATEIAAIERGGVQESSSAVWYSRISRVRVSSPITRPPSLLLSTGRLAAS